MGDGDPTAPWPLSSQISSFQDLSGANAWLELPLPAHPRPAGGRFLALRKTFLQALLKDSGISFDSALDCEKYELKVEPGTASLLGAALKSLSAIGYRAIIATPCELACR